MFGTLLFIYIMVSRYYLFHLFDAFGNYCTLILLFLICCFIYCDIIISFIVILLFQDIILFLDLLLHYCFGTLFLRICILSKYSCFWIFIVSFIDILLHMDFIISWYLFFQFYLYQNICIYSFINCFWGCFTLLCLLYHDCFNDISVKENMIARITFKLFQLYMIQGTNFPKKIRYLL